MPVMKLRIAQLSPYFSPHHGGVESFVRDISVEMARAGHEVTVFTSRYDRELPASEIFSGVQVVRLPVVATLFRTPFPRHLKRVAECDFDIYHSHTPPPSFAYMASSSPFARTGRNLVTYHCDSDMPSRLASPFIRTFDRYVTGRIMRRAVKVIVTTRTYSYTSTNTWRINPEIVPVSADTERFFPDPSDREAMRRKLGVEQCTVLLFVGRLVRHKGVQYLINALAGTGREIRLLIAGEGEYRQQIEHLISVRGLEGRVTMLGDVPDSLLPSLYRAADVLIVPSTSRLEAFSIAAVEGMASGIPVVVSDIPGVREVIEEGIQGVRVRPMDPDDLREKIEELASDERRRREMGKAGIRRASEFSSSNVAAMILDIYRRVLSDSG